MPSLTPLHEPYCTIQQAPPTQGDLLEGFAQLATSSIYGVTEIVQAIHREIVLRPLGLHTEKHQALWNKGVTGQMYGLIKKVMWRSGRGVALSLRTVNKMTPENKRRPLTPALHWLVGALNGVAGDHLIRMRNPMALPMMLYDRYGQPQRGELRGRVVILVHGLCMNHLSWDPGQSVGLGEQILYRQPFSNVLYLNYNTGRRISQNGRSLSRLLEQLIQRNPQITEIDLIGHSMGGLVSRSSLFYGKQSGSEWPFLIDHLICIGSPHHGAVLERLGFMLQERLGRLPFTAGTLGRLLDIRSAGVIDLRHGSVRDDDWEHLDGRRGQADDIRKPAPLPARVKAYLVAGTLERAPNSSKTMEVVGDYLVSVKSALGEHENALYRLNVPEHRKAVFYGVNHFQLQYHAAVRDQVIAWLIPNAYLPHSTNKRVEYVES